MPGFDHIINSKLNRLLEGGGYTETETINYKGNGGGTDILGDGNLLVKISDEPVNLENVTSYTAVAPNGAQAVFGNPGVTEFEGAQAIIVGTHDDGTPRVRIMSIPFTEGAEGFAGLYVMDDPDILYVSRIDFKTVVPFNPDYFPKGGVGYTDSYDIQWDGNTEGKVEVHFSEYVWYVKVSDKVLTKEELLGATYVDFNQNAVMITEQYIIDGSDIGLETQFFAVTNKIDPDTPMVVSCEACTVTINGITAVVPEDGTYFFYSDFMDNMYVSSLSNETIHKIDQKFLSGVCLPMVELTTEITEQGVTLTAEESAKLEAARNTGLPCVIKCVVMGQAINSVFFITIESGTPFFTFMFGAVSVRIFQLPDREWAAIVVVE